MPLISSKHLHNGHSKSPILASIAGSKRDKSANSSASHTPISRPSSPRIAAIPLAPLDLEIRIESPPLVLYGNVSDSTGTLLSGIFDVVVNQESPYTTAKVDLAIYQEVRQKRLNPQKCDKCRLHVTELAKWNVLKQMADLPKGRHGYPFSHLIPGSVPASCDNANFSISYYLKARAVPADAPPGAPRRGPIKLNVPLNLSRSVIKGLDRKSVRVFPPTDLVATVSMPSVVYPRSNMTFELQLEGVSSQNKNRMVKWRMRKINWRLDQTIKMNWRICDVHRPPPPALSGPQGENTGNLANGNGDNGANPAINGSNSAINSPNTSNIDRTGINNPSNPSINPSSNSTTTNNTFNNNLNSSTSNSTVNTSVTSTESSSSQDSNYTHHEAKKGKHKIQVNDDKVLEEVFTIAAGDFKEGWKSDFTDKGRIEFSTNNIQIPKDVCCKIDDQVYGLSVNHVLVVELIIAEESQTSKTSRQTMPTGAARILRMQFNMVVTDRSGLGIAWDDEVPPVYADVPLSPPDYNNVAQLPKFEELTPSITSVQGINSEENLH